MRWSQPLKWITWGGENCWGKAHGGRVGQENTELLPRAGLIVLMSYSESSCYHSNEEGRWRKYRGQYKVTGTCGCPLVWGRLYCRRAGQRFRSTQNLQVFNILYAGINLIETALLLGRHWIFPANQERLRWAVCVWPPMLCPPSASGAALGRGTGIGVPAAARSCCKPSREKHAYKREIQTF